MPLQALPLTRESVQTAHATIAPRIHRTPLLSSRLLTESAGLEDGTQILFKAENLQKGGAFKFRGATWSLSQLTEEEKSKGVCTHSSGNHAGCLALASSLLSIPAHIVMPSNCAPPKLSATKGYGATVRLSGPTSESREEILKLVQQETGATFIPPYDAVNTILGQGTVFLEMEEQSIKEGWGQLAAVVAPVGGGGLLAGIAVAAQGTGVKVFGAEPEGADDCFRGVAAGKRVESLVPNTIADGVRTPVGVINFPIIQKEVEAIITVSEEEIIESMQLIYERLKLVVEPTGALAFAAVRSENFKKVGIKGPVGVVLSGGNIDLSKPLPWIS
ncbi:tryptophan synthase beta subunit-like PLP-dependent enzyme [Meredithblackwellia eburnea MCA 4105]